MENGPRADAGRPARGLSTRAIVDLGLNASSFHGRLRTGSSLLVLVGLGLDRGPTSSAGPGAGVRRVLDGETEDEGSSAKKA